MKILERDILQDGTAIQIEEWSEDFRIFPYGSTVAAFPTKYMRVRAEANFKNHIDAKATFDKLIDGSMDVTDVDFTIMQPGGKRVLLKPILDERRRKILEPKQP